MPTAKIQIKIKTKDGKNIILENDEAKELYNELCKIYGKEKTTEYIPWTYPLYPYYYNEPITCAPFTTTGNIEITCKSETTY